MSQIFTKDDIQVTSLYFLKTKIIGNYIYVLEYVATPNPMH